jgi:hypothetical protein
VPETVREISKISANFFSNIPIDPYERGAPRQNPGPPLDSRPTKACFPQWVAGRGFLFAAKETTLGRLAGLKGPTATPAPKHAVFPPVARDGRLAHFKAITGLYCPHSPSSAMTRGFSVDERNPPTGENPVGKLSKRIGRFRERGSQNSSLQTPASRPVPLCDTRSSPPCWQHMIFEELREQAQGLLTDLGVRPPLLGKG